ncbi:uncharacterized protein LOC126887469 [Diabrotica virgifera virgifera]|uniref:Uncharacterized protein n=1 Tax=Diabrotica virgifera virgifera TaxID=50390 RepID=A0ABM5KL97_DIAVI|nr:uncharacterized protein LOC126887469 [Diabrotica virgifera virgifera]
MDFKLAVITVFSLVSISQASIIPTVEVLQGPGSKTLLIGPDGSAIDSAAPGGTVVTNDHGSGLVAAGPAILPLGPEIVVNSPAGSIITSHSLAGPAVVPGVVPALAPSAGAVISAAISVEGPAAQNVEGAYVPDNTEALYDDGSYKGEH